MSTYCTMLTVLNYMYSMFFSVLLLSMASPLSPTVYRLTLEHYYLVSLFIPRGTSLWLLFQKASSVSPRQICYQIHNLHCTKAFSTSCANPMQSESSSVPSCVLFFFVNFAGRIITLEPKSHKTSISYEMKNAFKLLHCLTKGCGGLEIVTSG